MCVRWSACLVMQNARESRVAQPPVMILPSLSETEGRLFCMFRAIDRPPLFQRHRYLCEPSCRCIGTAESKASEWQRCGVCVYLADITVPKVHIHKMQGSEGHSQCSRHIDTHTLYFWSFCILSRLICLEAWWIIYRVNQKYNDFCVLMVP